MINIFTYFLWFQTVLLMSCYKLLFLYFQICEVSWLISACNTDQNKAMSARWSSKFSCIILCVNVRLFLWRLKYWPIFSSIFFSRGGVSFWHPSLLWLLSHIVLYFMRSSLTFYENRTLNLFTLKMEKFWKFVALDILFPLNQMLS